MPPRPKPRAKKSAPSQPPPASSPSLGLPSCRGQVWDRVVRIHGMLQRGERFTCESLATTLEVPLRTVEHTLEFMRDRLELPLQWEPRLRSHVYTRPCPFLPAVRIDPDEAFVLKFLPQVLPAVVSPSQVETYRRVLKKFSVVVGGAESIASDASPGPVVPLAPPDDAEFRHLAIVSTAMEGEWRLQVDYQNADASAPQRRIVHPLRFSYFDHRWFVFAHDELRDAPRTFRLDRIHGAALLDRHFTPPTHYDPDAILRGNLGAYTGHEDHLVRLLLRGHAANDARTRRWHDSQKKIERPDGRLEITLRLNNLVDILHKVLYWGDQVEALAPTAFRTAVREALAATLAKYAG